MTGTKERKRSSTGYSGEDGGPGERLQLQLDVRDENNPFHSKDGKTLFRQPSRGEKRTGEGGEINGSLFSTNSSKTKKDRPGSVPRRENIQLLP